jgi:hypothetical protein
MLQIRPNCECCDKDLPASSSEARICTYECTFCAQCAEGVLQNVCPNCGGGFERRPVRPKSEQRPGVSLTQHPASSKRVHLKWDRATLSEFTDRVRAIPPAER